MKLLLANIPMEKCLWFPDPDGSKLHRNLGALAGPRYVSVEEHAHAGMAWGADNDCFKRFHPKEYVRMLDEIKHFPGCLFVTAPDVYQDGIKTAANFDRYAPWLEKRHLPIALVLQDGMEHRLKWLRHVWDRIAAVFVGGSDEFKLGPVGAHLVDEALERGKYVHWGRVSSRMRVRYIIHVGGHSFDSSTFSIYIKLKTARALALTLQPAPLARRRIKRVLDLLGTSK